MPPVSNRLMTNPSPGVGGEDFRDLPLEKRETRLFYAASRMNHEGIVSNPNDRPYRAGYSKDRIKVKTDGTTRSSA
jgi:hypothetical protein